MSRAKILIAEDLLSKLYNEHILGVSYTKIIKNYNLNITIPTLKNILKYYYYLLNTNTKYNDNVRQTLFPTWLSKPMMKSTGHNYEGIYPFGLWTN